MNVKHLLNKIWVQISIMVSPTRKGVICGHETKLYGHMNVFGKSITMKMPVNENGHPDYCLSCIGKMSIRCAWCGDPILIGESITLHAPKVTFKVPEYAVRYKEDERFLIGCLGWDCALTGADMCGRWMPPGEVVRFPSPLEIALQGNMVLVPDASKYPEGVSITPTKS